MKGMGSVKRVLVAMSGGVDSSVSALLLKQMGFDVIGINLLLFDRHAEDGSRSSEETDVKAVARKINIPLYVLDIRHKFKELIIEYFLKEYERARTPIPCARCNRYIKFDILLRKAEELGADYIATGHYAIKTKIGNRYYIKSALDKQKDQSYFLFSLSSDELKRIIFPVGYLKKSQVRDIAKAYELPVANKKDSQDICFKGGRDLKDLLEDLGLREKAGKIRDESGRIVGSHKGYYFFTLGQRRGLRVRLGKPVYIIGIDRHRNEVIVGPKERLLTRKFTVEDFRFANEDIEREAKEGLECIIKVRYAHQGNAGKIFVSGKRIYVEFYGEYGPVVSGQACVFYKDDIVIGGGFISDRNALNES